MGDDNDKAEKQRKEDEEESEEDSSSSASASSSENEEEKEEDPRTKAPVQVAPPANDGADSSKEPPQAKVAPSAEDGDDSPKAPQSQREQGSGSILTDATFESLGVTCRPLLEACERLGWKTATSIQAAVLPEALVKGNDVIGLAETGSGKTGAFCLPIFQRMLDQSVKSKTVALILTPTRELAFQIHQVCQALAVGMGATSVVVVGGVDRTSQAIALARHPHVVVATPGRLLDHLKDTKGFHLRNVRFLVLDEADRMLSMDFEQELHQILDQLSDDGGEASDRQTMLFSATMTSQVQKLQRASLKKNAVKIQVSTKFQTPSQLKQSYLFVPAKYKDCYLTYLINEHAGQSILVFCATCNNVQRLALMLRNLGFPAVCLHGQMHQSKRLGMLQKFSSGNRSILISTDVASRGLDLPSVDIVVNFDLPAHGKEYVHRVGRTARAGRSGKAISIVTQYDVEIYQRIEGLLGQKLPEYPSAGEETVLVLLERVSEAQRLATRELKEQLSARGGSRGGGGQRKRRGTDDGGGGGGGDGGMEATLQKELRRGYAGGSGGRGGALHNQKGSGKNTKKYRRK